MLSEKKRVKVLYDWADIVNHKAYPLLIDGQMYQIREHYSQSHEYASLANADGKSINLYLRFDCLRRWKDSDGKVNHDMRFYLSKSPIQFGHLVEVNAVLETY